MYFYYQVTFLVLNLKIKLISNIYNLLHKKSSIPAISLNYLPFNS